MSKKTGASELSYYYKSDNTKIIKGDKNVEEHVVIDGPKGLSIKKYINKDGKSEKIVLSKIGDVYKKTTTKTSGDKKGDPVVVELDKKSFKEEVEKNFDFALDYVNKNVKGGSLVATGGAKRRTRKSSKKTENKKSSKKGSKKTSRKRSRKGSK